MTIDEDKLRIAIALKVGWTRKRSAKYKSAYDYMDSTGAYAGTYHEADIPQLLPRYTRCLNAAWL